MKCHRLLLLLLPLFLIPGGDGAQTQESGCTDSGAAIVQRIAEAQGSTGVWEPEDCLSAGHVQSGLTCDATLLMDEPLWRLIVFDEEPGLGRDVGCDYQLANGGKLTVYATRYEIGIDAETAFADVLAAIYQRFPDSEPVEEPVFLPVQVAGYEGEVSPLVASFSVPLEDGTPGITSTWFQIIHGWELKIRVTQSAEPKDEALATSFMAAVMMAGAMEKVAAQAMGAP